MNTSRIKERNGQSTIMIKVPKNVKVIAFDADNTLYKLHTKKAYEKKFQFLSKETGIPAKKIEKTWKSIVEGLIGSKNPEKRKRENSMRMALMQLGVEKGKVNKLTTKALKIFWEKVVEDLEIFPEVEKLIEKLSKKYVLVIASDEFRKNLEMKLDKAIKNWKKYFRFLVTPEDTNEMKPSKRYYQLILKKLNVGPEEVLVIGNSVKYDLLPAEKMGMKTRRFNFLFTQNCYKNFSSSWSIEL